MRVKKAIKVFEKIRDLPYGTSGSDEVWSCYQKCVLLKQELQHIGITSQLLIGVFWLARPADPRTHPQNSPPTIWETCDTTRVYWWICVRCRPIIDIGLTPTLPMACWDGKSSTTTMVPLRRLRVYRPHSLHERILSQLRRKIFRSNPESFYTAIDIWLATIRVSWYFILVCYITIYSFYSKLQRVKIAFSLSRLERNYCIWRQLLVSRIERSAFSLSSFGGLFSLILYYSHLNNLIATR